MLGIKDAVLNINRTNNREEIMKGLLLFVLLVSSTAFAASTPGESLSAIKCAATLASETKGQAVKQTATGTKEVKEVGSVQK